jgi:hypothetical protein
VRLLATTSFATLVKLVPLEAGIPDPPGFSAELLIRSELGLDRDWNFERLNLAHIQHLGHELPLSVTFLSLAE